MPNRQPRHSRSAKIERWVWVTVVATAVVIFLLLIPAVLLSISWDRAEAAYEEQVTRLREAGLPVTAAEVNKLYHEHGRDPAENAAPIYDRAFSQMKLSREEEEQLSNLTKLAQEVEPVAEDQVAAAAATIEKYVPAIDLLKAAAALPYLRYDSDFTLGPKLLIPHVGQLRAAARLLMAEAIAPAHASDGARAGAAVVAMVEVRGIEERPVRRERLPAEEERRE